MKEMTGERGLMAGFARADITPPVPMANYKGEMLAIPPEGEPCLQCLAAVFAAGEQRVGLVVLDTLCVRRELVLRMREEACLRGTGAALSGLIVSATHTHCTPPLAPMFLTGVNPDPLYEDLVVKKVLDALSHAHGNSCNVQLGTGIAACPGFEFPRRLLRRGGRVVMNVAADVERGLEPCSCVDHDVPFWLFRTASGDPLGVVFSYPNHNNAARSSFMSPDIAGYCRRALAEHFGRDFLVLMIQGACGDVNWVREKERKGGAHYAEVIGTELAESLVNALSGAAPASHVQKLDYRKRLMVLPDRLPEDSEYCEDGCRGSSPAEMEAQRSRYELEREAVNRRGATKVVVEVDALVLRNTALVTTPAELFSELGMEIRARSPFPVTLVSGPANGYVGYVPSEDAFTQGGYETHRTVYTSRLDKHAGRRILEASLQLLSQTGAGADAD